ncbi:hypothetical protein [Halosimplex pelagicum]|uniref:Uncharacterized protein n=1 Tax=Halosimplex pelagicum TaxID=869886 RepID=A0A7D5TBJ7_9EURY|nr:hypothetical protein [Halosimplex pelagicum]QLH83770.1 hypothetical protein HZS54_20000 [Halosimplex pelagicum]
MEDEKSPQNQSEHEHANSIVEVTDDASEQKLVADGGPQLPDSPEFNQWRLESTRRTDSIVVDSTLIEGSYELTLESECAGTWFEQVPARRTAVLHNEFLWRIPDNWEYFARITHEDEPDEILYKIPESRVSVVITEEKDGIRSRSGYRVLSIGRIQTRPTEMPDKNALIQLLRSIEDEDNHPSEAIEDTLQYLLEHWHRFETSYRQYYEKWSSKLMMNAFRGDRDDTFDSWSVEPWEVEQVIGHLVSDTINCARETADAVNDAFMEAGVVSPSPTVTLSVQETRLPIGYRAQALTELGCSSDETMDYLIDQFETKPDISGEAAREVDEQNVRAVRHALK